MFKTHVINNEVVKKMPTHAEEDKRPIKGANLFPELYANVFLCSKKKSGKTSVIYNIVRKCAGPKTKIIAFCSTLHKDDSWNTIKTWSENKGLPFIGHTSLKEDGVDLLDDLIQGLAEKTVEIQGLAEKGKKRGRNLLDSDDEDETERPEKYRSPEYLIILDDLSNELKSESITALLKKNRHFKAKIIISSQYLNDLLPAARKQLDYFLLFKGHPHTKLDEIYRDADISIPMDEFYALYKFATEEPHSFLWIDTIDGTFRRNFNTLILDSIA